MNSKIFYFIMTIVLAFIVTIAMLVWCWPFTIFLILLSGGVAWLMIFNGYAANYCWLTFPVAVLLVMLVVGIVIRQFTGKKQRPIIG